MVNTVKCLREICERASHMSAGFKQTVYGVRKVKKTLISLSLMWFCCSVFAVKWQGMLSNTFEIHCGVRQGGVLSPSFFAIYVDDLLVALHSSRLGCHVNGVSVNSSMYADDLIILSASVFGMQKLLNLCTCELKDI